MPDESLKGQPPAKPWLTDLKSLINLFSPRGFDHKTGLLLWLGAFVFFLSAGFNP